MHRRLGSGDRDKLDQYLTGVREIETRIEKVERIGNGGGSGGRYATGHTAGLRGIHPADV